MRRIAVATLFLFSVACAEPTPVSDDPHALQGIAWGTPDFIPGEPPPVEEPDVTMLENGEIVAGVAGAAGTWSFFQIDVPEDQTRLWVETWSGSGDVDLYLRRDDLPTLDEWDVRPLRNGNVEPVDLAGPAGGSWFIGLHGYADYDGVKLGAEYTDDLLPDYLLNHWVERDLSGTPGSWRYYRIHLGANVETLEVEIRSGTGDADLYLRQHWMPSRFIYDERSAGLGNWETVTLENPNNGWYYIGVRGYDDYRDIRLQASW